jgi:hypothetical protein
MKENIITLILFIVLFQACKVQKDLYKVSGKIADEDGFYCEVFTSEKRISKFQIELPYKKKDFSGKFKNHSLNSFRWFINDQLLAVEGVEVGHEGMICSNLVIVDINGEVVERLTDNKKYHYIGYAYATKSGRKIFYTSSYNPPPVKMDHNKEDISKRLNPSSALHIMDYKTREVEVTIENFSKDKGGMLTFRESPWSPDERMFIYTIQKKPLVTLMGESVDDRDTTIGGSYIFDIEKKQDVKFIPGSYQAIWSPNGNTIAYLKKRNIWLYDWEKDLHTPFIGSSDDFKINDIHWTPEGDYIYVQCIYKGKYSEKLFSVRDGKEIPFKKLKLKDPYYTWK